MTCRLSQNAGLGNFDISSFQADFIVHGLHSPGFLGQFTVLSKEVPGSPGHNLTLFSSDSPLGVVPFTTVDGEQVTQPLCTYIEEATLGSVRIRNLLFDSNDFLTSNWTTTAGTLGITYDQVSPFGITADSVGPPHGNDRWSEDWTEGAVDGATLLDDQDAGNNPGLKPVSAISTAANTSYTFSMFVKEASTTKNTNKSSLNFAFSTVYDTTAVIDFTLATPTMTHTINIGSITPTHTVEDVGSGWFRVSITFSKDAVLAATDFTPAITPTNTGTLHGIIIYGLQFEEGEQVSGSAAFNTYLLETAPGYAGHTGSSIKVVDFIKKIDNISKVSAPATLSWTINPGLGANRGAIEWMKVRLAYTPEEPINPQVLDYDIREVEFYPHTTVTESGTFHRTIKVDQDSVPGYDPYQFEFVNIPSGRYQLISEVKQTFNPNPYFVTSGFLVGDERLKLAPSGVPTSGVNPLEVQLYSNAEYNATNWIYRSNDLHVDPWKARTQFLPLISPSLLTDPLVLKDLKDFYGQVNSATQIRGTSFISPWIVEQDVALPFRDHDYTFSFFAKQAGDDNFIVQTSGFGPDPFSADGSDFRVGHCYTWTDSLTPDIPTIVEETTLSPTFGSRKLTYGGPFIVDHSVKDMGLGWFRVAYTLRSQLIAKSTGIRVAIGPLLQGIGGVLPAPNAITRSVIDGIKAGDTPTLTHIPHIVKTIGHPTHPNAPDPLASDGGWDYNTLKDWADDINLDTKYNDGEAAIGEVTGLVIDDVDAGAYTVEINPSDHLRKVILRPAAGQKHSGESTGPSGGTIIPQNCNPAFPPVIPYPDLTSLPHLFPSAKLAICNPCTPSIPPVLYIKITGSHSLCTDIIIEDLEILNQVTDLQTRVIHVEDINANTTVTIRRCIIYTLNSDDPPGSTSPKILINNANDADILIYNNIIYQKNSPAPSAPGHAGIHDDTGAGPNKGALIYNNTICRNNIGILSANFEDIRNNICMDSLTDDFDLTGTGTRDFNMSEDATATGTNSLTNRTFTDQFINTAIPPFDLNFMLKLNSDAADSGEDLKVAGVTVNEIEFDIIDINRETYNASFITPRTWDIGASEFKPTKQERPEDGIKLIENTPFPRGAQITPAIIQDAIVLSENNPFPHGGQIFVPLQDVALLVQPDPIPRFTSTQFYYAFQLETGDTINTVKPFDDLFSLDPPVLGSGYIGHTQGEPLTLSIPSGEFNFVHWDLGTDRIYGPHAVVWAPKDFYQNPIHTFDRQGFYNPVVTYIADTIVEGDYILSEVLPSGFILQPC